METWALILIILIIIVVIAVIAWLVYKYHKQPDNSGGDSGSGGNTGGNNGNVPVPDNFSTLYRRLQPQVKTTTKSITEMDTWLIELNRKSTCKNIINETDLLSDFTKFQASWINFTQIATGPVSDIYSNGSSSLLVADKIVNEDFDKIPKDIKKFESSVWDLFCHKDLLKHFGEAGDLTDQNLVKVRNTVTTMVKMSNIKK